MEWLTATEVAFVGLVLFVILLIYLKVPAMIAGALDNQSQAIAKELHDARKLREEAEALLAEYEAKRAAAEQYGLRSQLRISFSPTTHRSRRALEHQRQTRFRFGNVQLPGILTLAGTETSLSVPAVI